MIVNQHFLVDDARSGLFKGSPKNLGGKTWYQAYTQLTILMGGKKEYSVALGSDPLEPYIDVHHK